MAKLIFPEDGWYRFEKFEQLLFIRGIPDDPLIRAGHYHQDLGHFSLYKTGAPILVDGGRRNYSDDNWGNFGLHPEAHNTITIDDYGVTPNRPTRFPSCYSNAKFRVSNLENEEYLQVAIETSGFNRIHPTLMWRRTIKISQKQFEVQDIICGVDERLITTFFHFSNPMTIIKGEETVLKLQDSSLGGVFHYDYANDGQPNMHKGGESLLGWQAVSYGKVVPAPTMVFREYVKLPVRCNYKIIWSQN